jgi:hypothetical protein
MDSNTELDINLVIAALREQIGLLALDKAMLTARLTVLETQLKERDDRE